jgi:hypothetical protein
MKLAGAKTISSKQSHRASPISIGRFEIEQPATTGRARPPWRGDRLLNLATKNVLQPARRFLDATHRNDELHALSLGFGVCLAHRFVRVVLRLAAIVGLREIVVVSSCDSRWEYEQPKRVHSGSPLAVSGAGLGGPNEQHLGVGSSLQSDVRIFVDLMAWSDRLVRSLKPPGSRVSPSRQL